MTTAENPNEQVVLDFFDAFSRSDREDIRKLLHPDAIWEQMAPAMPGAGVYRGQKAIVDELLNIIFGAFDRPPTPRVILKTLLSKGDLVVAETESRELSKDGRTYNNVYCWVVEMRDGRIAAIREYFDSHYAVLFMAAASAPTADARTGA